MAQSVRRKWQDWAGMALACAVVVLSAEGAAYALSATKLADEAGGFIGMVAFFLSKDQGFSQEIVLRLGFALISSMNIVCASVGIWVLRRSAESAAGRQAAGLLIVGALLGFYAFFLSSFDRYQAALPFLKPVAGSLYATALFALLGYFFAGLARFLVLFPRPVETDTILEALPMGSRLRRLADLKAVLPSVWRWHRALMGGRALLVGSLLGLSMVPLINSVDWLGRVAGGGLNVALGGVMATLLFALMIFYGAGLWFAFGSLNHVYRFGSTAERQRVTWLRASALVLMFPFVLGFAWIFVPQTIREVLVGRHTDLVAFVVLLYLALLPQLIALVLSSAVVQRGVLDPSAGFKRFTLWTALGVLVTVLFVLAERFVALKVVKWFQLPPDTGAVIAGGLIAITFVPLRRLVSKYVTKLAERWLPVSTVAEGEQTKAAVVIIDLSGYTALSATDGDAARLQSATLKRAAQVALDATRGRIVKSLGDAVMLSVESPRDALKVAQGVHASFPTMIAALGMTALPLHSSIHVGEFIVAHDGDIFGHTVNVAARLVDAAKAGEIILSRDAVTGAGAESLVEAAGTRKFKNVPEPIECFRVLAKPTEVASQASPALPSTT